MYWEVNILENTWTKSSVLTLTKFMKLSKKPIFYTAKGSPSTPIVTFYALKTNLMQELSELFIMSNFSCKPILGSFGNVIPPIIECIFLRLSSEKRALYSVVAMPLYVGFADNYTVILQKTDRQTFLSIYLHRFTQ